MINYWRVVDCANQSDWFKGKEPSSTNVNHQSAIIFQITEPFLALWRAFSGFPHCWIHLNSPESIFIHVNQLFFTSSTSNMATIQNVVEKKWVNKLLSVTSEENHIITCVAHIKIRADILLFFVSHLAPCFSVSLKPETMGERGEKKALWPWAVSFIDLLLLGWGRFEALTLIPASDLLQQSRRGKVSAEHHPRRASVNE